MLKHRVRRLGLGLLRSTVGFRASVLHGFPVFEMGN